MLSRYTRIRMGREQDLLKRALLLVSFLFLISGEITAQFPQMRRTEERRQRAIEADEKRQRELEESRSSTALPKPKPAVLNQDVRIVLANRDVRSFAEASNNQVKKIADGESLWLYVKFKTKLGDYVLTLPDPENQPGLMYRLYAEIAPQNDPTALGQYVLQFSKEDLEKTELKINLSPGMPGRNAAIPIFLDVAATRRPGVWSNDFRLTNTTLIPRAATENLAIANVVFEFPGRVTKYPGLRDDFESMVLRGTTDLAALPIIGSFYSLPIKTTIVARLKAVGITPVRFYFASDNWSEHGASMLFPEKRRTVYAAYTYRKSEDCFYGVAEFKQKFDSSAGQFVDDSIKFANDLAIECSKLE